MYVSVCVDVCGGRDIGQHLSQMDPHAFGPQSTDLETNQIIVADY